MGIRVYYGFWVEYSRVWVKVIIFIPSPNLYPQDRLAGDDDQKIDITNRQK